MPLPHLKVADRDHFAAKEVWEDGREAPVDAEPLPSDELIPPEDVPSASSDPITLAEYMQQADDDDEDFYMYSDDEETSQSQPQSNHPDFLEPPPMDG